MSAGPIQRIAGGVGLAALAPTAYLLATGSLSVEDAAIRALVTLAAVMVVGRAADRSLSRLADVLEREGSSADAQRDRNHADTPRSDQGRATSAGRRSGDAA